MPGGFTGNGSVQWFIDAKNVDTTKGPHSQAGVSGTTTHHQDGTDKTTKGGYFTITIKYPQDPVERNAFRLQLYAAWNDSADNHVSEVEFKIPIEDVNSSVGQTYTGNGKSNQIYIDW